MNELQEAFVRGFVKTAEKAKKQKKIDPDDYLAGGLTGFLGNTVLPYQNFRAGKATALAEAMGDDVPLHLRRPELSRNLHVLLGAMAGSGVGGGLGYGLGHAIKYLDPTKTDAPNAAGISGVVGGAVGGAGLGVLYDVLKRGKSIKEIKQKYKEQGGEIPKPESRGTLKKLFSFLGNPHYAGRRVMYNEAQKDKLNPLAYTNRAANVSNALGTGMIAASGALSSTVPPLLPIATVLAYMQHGNLATLEDDKKLLKRVQEAEKIRRTVEGKK